MKAKDIALHVSGELRGDGEVDIRRVASLTKAGPGDIAFVDGGPVPSSNASCLIV